MENKRLAVLLRDILLSSKNKNLESEIKYMMKKSSLIFVKWTHSFFDFSKAV